MELKTGLFDKSRRSKSVSSWQSQFIKFLMRQNIRKMDHLNIHVWDEHTSVTAWREYCENGAAKAKMPAGIETIPVKIPGLPAGLAAEWLKPNATATVSAVEEAVIFYIHGGGYVSGSCADHRALVSKLVAVSGIRLLLFEYRLAPEHPFPAALEDTLTAYRWLIEQIEPSTRVIIAGNSAGGGLCLATLLALKDLVAQGETDLKLPVAGVSISPNTDMSFTGKPNWVKGSIEPEGMAEICSKYYAGDNNPSHPYISPLYGDLRGLPPLLITVGDEEGGLDDSVRFADKAKTAGVKVQLIVGRGQIHCFPLLPDFIPEARQAMAEICSFMSNHIHQAYLIRAS
jgi:epsilon-lactone hydrolase